MTPWSRVLSGLFAAAYGLVAQVPVGVAIHGSIGGGSAPLMLLDRGGGLTPITGAPAAEINCLRIDPVDGSLWLASLSGGPLYRGVVAGTTFLLTATAPGIVATMTAIAFDQDCHPLVAVHDSVFRFHRASGAMTPLVAFTNPINALDEDPATGDVYVGTFLDGRLYRLSPPGYATPTFLGTTLTVPMPLLSGISFVRSPAAPLGMLFISAFGSGRNNSLITYDLQSGVFAGIPGVPAWPDLTWVDYDSVAGDLWLASTSGTRNLYTSTVTGTNQLLATLPGGVPACIEVNDVDPAAAVLTVCPRNVPTPTAPITLELGVAGHPGEFAVVVMTAPFVAVLAWGPVDTGGRFAAALPGVQVPAGTPGALTFVAATIDLATLAVKLSSPVGWPRN